jgi:hypothetical protein
LKYTIGEDANALVRFFMKYTGGPPSNADCAALAASIIASWGAHLIGFHTTDRMLDSVSVTDLTSSTAGEATTAAGTAGTEGGGKLPADVCLLEQLEVGRRFRGGHPRKYWPMGSDTNLADAQKWDATWLGTVLVALDAFYAAFAGSTFGSTTLVGGVNVSYYSGFTVHTGTTGRARNISTVRLAPVLDTVLARNVAQGIASQRKRLLRLA